MDAPPPPQTNVLAWIALVLGVLTPVTCGGTGPFALFFGFLALRRVNLSDGRLPGGRAARVAIILGGAGIVFFLGGLFVVGLNHLRGKSQVAACTNNLRRIGQAVNLYHEDQQPRHFPPGTIRADLPPDRRLSWMVAILPYMEPEPLSVPPTAKAGTTFHKGEGLYARFDVTKGAEAEQNREAMAAFHAWFGCPAGLSRPVPGEPALTQYVGIAGFGTEAPTLTKTDPYAGFFGYDRVINRADVKRGTSQTMMVAERKDGCGPWAVGGPATVTGVDRAKQPYVPGQFGGLHYQIAKVLFADSHVVPVSDRADPLVWEKQSRINVDE